MKRITEWIWMFMCFEIALLCFNETDAGQTALDITMSMPRKHNTSANCESNNEGLKNCRFHIEETSSEILTNGATSTIFPEYIQCINTDSNRCLICLHRQWFANSCSKLYSLPKLKCPELTNRIFLKPGSLTANIVWKDPTVDTATRLTTYNNGIESGQNVTSGFYSLLYSATNNQGWTSVCTTEFQVAEVKCVLPTIPEGGTRTCNGGSLGSNCHLKCFVGFYLDQQYDVITCGLNGEYDRQSPKCLNLSPPKITCFPPSNHIIPVDSVSLTAVATWDFPVAVDQSGANIKPINIHQVSSIYLSGDVIPRGLHYFQYDVIDVNGASDSCSFTIDMRFIQCSALKPPVNGNIKCNSTDFRQNTQCVYSCIPAYILFGSPVLTCQNTENYDYPEPSCHILKCPEPSQLSRNSYVSCSNNNNINSTCVVLCKPGFNLTSSNNTATCLPSGNWNTSFPSCTDSEPPVFISCPQTNIFQHYDKQFENSVPVIWSVIIATDNFGEEITPEVIQGQDSGELFYPGVTRIQYRAVDSTGNEAICQFHVIMSVLASGCSAGTRFNENPDNCIKCAVGFYQNSENTLECKPCPEGFTTKSLGASTIQDCKKNETLLSRDKRAVTSCSEPELDDPSMLFKCTGYDMNDVCQLSCLSGRQPVGSNRIVCVFDLNTGRFVWLSESDEQPRCRPQGDLVGMLCAICKQFMPGANCCPVHDLKHTEWMPMDFAEIKPQTPCEDFVPPATGQSYASIISGVKSFTLTCPSDKSLPRNSRTTTCDLKTGVWNPAPWLQECTKKYYPIKYRLEMTARYTGKDCSSPGVREQLRLGFTSLLHSSKVWIYHCPSSRQCSADDVMVICSYYRRKRRDIRKRAGTMYKTDIKWHFSIRLLEDEMKGEKVKQLKDVLFNMFFGFADDTYSGNFNQIFGFSFDYASLNMGEFTYVCDTGGVYDIATKACLVCPSGSMYDVNTDRCIECTRGYYQDRENSRTCFQCQPRTTTQYTGSKYHTQCQIQCSASYFSANGFLPCLPCPSRGTSSRGSTKCQHKRPLPQIRDFCSNSSCIANNHTCQNTDDGYRCYCKAGYRGKECNITINPCTYIQCENGGVCQASPGGKPICRCPDGYIGNFCQTKIVKDGDQTSTWTEWVSWGDCRTRLPGCGQGIQTRARICIKDLKGTQCPGGDTDSRECNKIGCPVCKEENLKVPYSIKLTCSWSNNSVSDVLVFVCNVSCREGYTSLSNVSHVTCKNGIWTSGLAKNICIVEAEWSDWSAWSNCPSVCDGERQRTRICSNPPLYSGPPLCKGDNLQSYPCRLDYHDRQCSKCSVSDLLIPPTMNVFCSVIKGILTCIMRCRLIQVLYDKLALNHAYTCNQGIWSPSNNVLPCSDFHQPLALSKIISATYQTNCTDTSKASYFTTEISRNLNSITNSTSHQVLVQTPKCTTDDLVVTIRIKTSINESNSFIQASESVSAMTRNQRVFAINSSEDEILPVSVAEISQLHCPDNTVARGAYCVECPVGSYYHLDECLLCPVGYYQPSAGQCSCIRCLFRTTTRYLGSWSLLDCK